MVVKCHHTRTLHLVQHHRSCTRLHLLINYWEHNIIVSTNICSINKKKLNFSQDICYASSQLCIWLQLMFSHSLQVHNIRAISNAQAPGPSKPVGKGRVLAHPLPPVELNCSIHDPTCHLCHCHLDCCNLMGGMQKGRSVATLLTWNDS